VVVVGHFDRCPAFERSRRCKLVAPQLSAQAHRDEVRAHSLGDLGAAWHEFAPQRASLILRQRHLALHADQALAHERFDSGGHLPASSYARCAELQLQ
jgi:hypothetical protein